MAITYTWQVTNLKRMDVEGNTNVVVHSRWTRTGTDENGHEGSFQGATPLRLPESGSGNFTPFEDLTEEQVVEWIKTEIASNPGYEEHIVQQITKQIEAKKNPVVDVDRLPWGVQVVGAPAPGAEGATVSTAPRYVDVGGIGS